MSKPKRNGTIEKLQKIPNDELDIDEYLDKNTTVAVLQYIVGRDLKTWHQMLDICTANENMEGVSFIIDNGKTTQYSFGGDVMTWDIYFHRMVLDNRVNIVKWIVEKSKSKDYTGAFKELWYYRSEDHKQYIHTMKLLKECIKDATEDEYVDAVCKPLCSSLMTLDIAVLILEDVKYRRNIVTMAFSKLRFDDNNYLEVIKIMKMLKNQMTIYDVGYKEAYIHVLKFGEVTCEVVSLILEDTEYTNEIITEVIKGRIFSKDKGVFACLFSKLDLGNVDKLNLLKTITWNHKVPDIKIVATHPEFASIIPEVFLYMIDSPEYTKKLIETGVDIDGDPAIEEIAKEGDVDLIEFILKYDNVSISDKNALLNRTLDITKNHLTAFRLACKYKNIPLLKQEISKISTQLIRQELDKLQDVHVDVVGDLAVAISETDHDYFTVLYQEIEKRSLSHGIVLEDENVEEIKIRKLKKEAEKELIEKHKAKEKQIQKEIQKEKRERLFHWVKDLLYIPYKKKKSN